MEADEDKIRNLLHRGLPSVDQEKFNVKISGGRVDIEVPEEAFFLEGLQVAKRTITADIEKFFPKLETVTFVETFKKPAPPQPSAVPKAAEAAAPAAAPAQT
jgi:hypothetical protein